MGDDLCAPFAATVCRRHKAKNNVLVNLRPGPACPPLNAQALPGQKMVSTKYLEASGKSDNTFSLRKKTLLSKLRAHFSYPLMLF